MLSFYFHNNFGVINMATMNISLPDTLKDEMNKQPQVVWSHVAVKAFENEVQKNIKNNEVTDMPQAIARLQASKKTYSDALKTEGYQYGLEWAMKYAEYEELVTIKKYTERHGMPKNIYELEKILDDTSVEFDDLKDSEIESAKFTDGLVTAALEVLEKAKAAD